MKMLEDNLVYFTSRLLRMDVKNLGIKLCHLKKMMYFVCLWSIGITKLQHNLIW